MDFAKRAKFNSMLLESEEQLMRLDDPEDAIKCLQFQKLVRYLNKVNITKQNWPLVRKKHPTLTIMMLDQIMS